MKNKTAFVWGILIVLALSCSPLGFAAGEQIKLSLADRYTGGETVLVKIAYAGADGSPFLVDKPSRIKIDITKPDGNVVKSEARRQGWNAPGEYFDVYTIDYMGTYSVKVTDPETGAEATAGFDSVFLTGGSLAVLIFGVLLLVVCIIYWTIASRKKATRA